MRFLFWGILAILPTPVLNAGVDDDVAAGLSALYNLNYEEAQRNFHAITEQSPGNPLGPYALTTALWWELTNEYDEKNPALEREFLAAANRAIVFAKKKSEDEDASGLSHLCLGGALGLKSRWEAIQGQWIKAYLHGKQAFKAQERAIELNPELYDAYLGVGIFHYYTATLPATVRVLARLVFGGNKEQGLNEIRLAMAKGHFSRTAARLFLIGIYNNTEKDYPAALALVREGRKEFPQSSFFHFVELLTLENARDWEGVRAGAHDFLARVERQEPSYLKKYVHRAYFSLANSYLGENRPPEALAIYNSILEKYPLEDRWISLTYLNRGKAFDLLGRREEALKDYRAVLKRRDVWGLHDQAKELIDRPHQPPPAAPPLIK
ncbi:MAG: tetratricopeptide repeat protein [Elusimicrobia bacterium]|nr:tetratricopeptide repeat protein [Elusimicrobiota bacterium]